MVSIYGSWDFVSTNGYINGATNFMSNDDQQNFFGPIGRLLQHGNAPALAVQAYIAVGAVGDHNYGGQAP
jgi:hypothetical protein